MIKWLKEHTGWFIFIVISVLLLIGATVFLLVTYSEYIFTESTLAIVIFVGLGFIIAGLGIVAFKVVSK